jgi:caffeoyl-CoA O-methyltransferase
MSFKSIGISDDLHAYVLAHAPADPLVDELAAETRTALGELARLQIAPEQAPFMTFLTQLVAPRVAVEVGTFTGLSALSIARGLPAGGRLICCDVSAEYTAIALRYWARAGVDDRIELRLGPAASTLADMPAEPHIDLAFIDADKTGYPTYWDLLVPRMRAGGVIVVDNVLRGGRVVTGAESADDVAMLAFNDMVSADGRVASFIMPFADGLTLARKR